MLLPFPTLYYLYSMGKTEIIAHWLTMAERDWKSVQALNEAGQYMHALFFSHLVIEKILKAHWAKDNIETEPPRIHDLEYLYNQTDLKLSSPQVDLLGVMNSWNLEGRYQDYKDKFYKRTTKAYTQEKLNQVDSLRVCLLSELHSKK